MCKDEQHLMIGDREMKENASPGSGDGRSKPNSTARKTLLDPYHDLASSMFDVADTPEMEATFLTAAKEGDFAQIEALLKRRNETIFSLDVRDKTTGNTALVWAAKRGHSKIVDLLLRYGADVTLRNYDCQTAVEVASPQIQQLLLTSVGIGGPHRNLRQAAWQGDSNLVKKILAETQVDINCRNDEGLTPLLLVTRDVMLFEKLGSKLSADRSYDPHQVIEELLTHRADPNAMDGEGKTALHYVSASKAKVAADLVIKLLGDGSDIEARDRRCFTPIHCASQNGNVDVVSSLLKSGSDANARGYAGTTPLHISAINGHDQVACILLKGGADVTLYDDSGLTAVDVAKTKKVKSTLKHAWSDATQNKEQRNLAPVKEGSARSQSANKKKGGEVIFDSLTSSSMNLESARLKRPGFSKRFEDRGRPTNDVIPIPADENRISGARCGSQLSQTPRSPKTRRLQPIKAASPRKTPIAQPAIGSVKFGPGTKIHDGSSYSRHGSNERGLQKCPSDPGKYPQGGIQIPVTILDLDLEENLQDVKVRRVLHGPAGPSLPKKGHIRHHSDPNTSESPVQTELRDQCIAEETNSVSQEDNQDCEPNLPPTFVTQMDGDMRLSECVSRNSSPEADDGISLVINNPAPISALKENFSIEESQVRTSSDSGLAADASKSGSLASSGSNSSSGSPRPKEEVKGRSSSTPRERSSSQSSDGPTRGASADRSRPKSQAVPPRPKEPPPKPPANEVVKVNFLTENLDVKTARQSKPIMGVNGGLTRRTSNPRNMPMRPNVPPKKPNLVQQIKDSKTPRQNSALKVRNIQRPNTSTKPKPSTEKTDKTKAPPRPPKPSSNLTKASDSKVSPTSESSPKKQSNIQETPAPVKPSEHTGPVIQDPFESLRREREESKAKEVKAKVQTTRTKSAVTKKPVNNPPKKAFEARGTSACKKKVKPKEPPEAKVTLNTNKRKVKTAKGRTEKKDSMTLSENDNAAFVSGIGWHIEASRQEALVKERDDSSGSEEDVPKVVPNYDAAPSPMIVRRESVDQDKLRRSLELTSSQMPGQTDQNVEEIVSDEEEEMAAEVMCDEVVFNEAERYQEMLLEAELKARVEEAFEQSKVIPQTIKALEEFSKSMMNEDLTRILEDDLKNPANENAKCILVKEASEAADEFPLNLEAVKDVTPISAVEEISPKNSPLHRSASLRASIPAQASPLSSPFQSPTHQSPLHRAASLRGASHRPSQPLGTIPSQQANVFPTQLSPHRSPQHRLTSTNDCSPRVPQSTAQSTPNVQSSKPLYTPTSSASISSPVKQSQSLSSTASKCHPHKTTASTTAQSDQPSSILKQPTSASSPSKASTTSVPASSQATKPTSTVTHSQSASQSSTKQRSSRATKSTGKNPRAPRTREQEEREINHMIDEILKSTPDPTLSLSWRTDRKLTNKLKGMTEEELAKELRLSAGATFEQIPNKAEPPPKRMSESDDHGSFGEEEMETIEKLALALKDLPLKVTDDDEETVVGKPPKAPKSKTTAACDAKSPRFVRKHDSYRKNEVVASKEVDDWSDSEFGSTFSLPVGHDDSLVHTDRGEVVTSRLGGRRNSNSRAPSAMTNETNEEVETIQWKRGNMLGKGAYGTVWCGLTNTGGLIAVKQIELNTDNMDRAELEYEKIQEEVELLKNLNHKNIVGYLGTSLEEHIVSIFMEFVPGGSIANLLARFGALEEEVFCHYTRQILEGVQYLHANHVIHRDIKGGNIMLMPNSEIKLIDFGCAKRLCLNMSVGSRTKSSSHNRLLKSMRGTPYWMAPEVVKEEGHGTRSDIWSIGCTVFEMATRKPPWAEMPPMTAIFAIGSDSKPVPQLPEKFSSEARQFVNLCLSRDQNKRPSAVQMLNHAFITKRKKSKIS